jgi:DNA repair exonuclease SbcCD nuclease subunit
MEGPAVERIRTATRKAFENLIDEAIERKVAFIVIAGDLYDGDWRDYQTGLFFVRQMGRLASEGIQAFILYGNHDAESQITKKLTLPDNVRVFPAKRPETFRLENINAALHGRGYSSRDITENLAASYPEPVHGAFNIGVLHTGMGGMDGHANYAPCVLGELLAKGYDYWALGHVHQGRVINENPHVVFPGNLQGRHIRETGPKGAYLVTVEDNVITGFSLIHTDVVRWEVVNVDAAGCEHIEEAAERVGAALEDAISSRTGGCMLACRVELTGSTKIHDGLLLSGNHILAEARALALGFGDEAAWIERVVVSTKPARAEQTDTGEFFGDLYDILGEATENDELQKLLKTDLSEIVSRIKTDLKLAADRENYIDDAVLCAALQSDYPALIGYTQEYLKALLKTTED